MSLHLHQMREEYLEDNESKEGHPYSDQPIILLITSIRIPSILEDEVDQSPSSSFLLFPFHSNVSMVILPMHFHMRCNRQTKDHRIEKHLYSHDIQEMHIEPQL